MENRLCFECGQKFYGRSDKKFCDDYCRNLHNNRLNSDSTNYIRNINNTLRKNRRILESFFTAQPEQLPWHILARAGFDFSYCTHIEKNKDGKPVFTATNMVTCFAILSGC